jgi:hypothetical protein
MSHSTGPKKTAKDRKGETAHMKKELKRETLHSLEKQVLDICIEEVLKEAVVATLQECSSL